MTPMHRAPALGRWFLVALLTLAGPSARCFAGTPWVTLQGGHFLVKRANDGDSFHISVAGKEYIFRLYFVDTPETTATKGQTAPNYNATGINGRCGPWGIGAVGSGGGYYDYWGSAHPGGFNAALADGSVRVINYSVPLATLRALSDRDDGIPVQLDS